MFVTDKLLTRVFALCYLLLPQIAFSDKAPTHCLVDDAVVPYDSYCKGSDVFITASSNGAELHIRGAAKKVIDAGLSFCSQQEFKYDRLLHRYIIEGGIFFDSELVAACSFSEQKQLTPIALKQLQHRKISLPPSKVTAAVAAWTEFRQPNAYGFRGRHSFVLPAGPFVGTDKESGALQYKSYSLNTLPVLVTVVLPFTATRGSPTFRTTNFQVRVEITPSSPPKLNSEGIWLASPAITGGEEGSDTVVRMKILWGKELITKPEIYNKFFKEIADSAFTESIQFEPIPIE